MGRDYKHKCNKCGIVWFGFLESPKTCPKSHKNWNEPVEFDPDIVIVDYEFKVKRKK